jgi:membrane protease YdiL (CAAX protease family)
MMEPTVATRILSRGQLALALWLAGMTGVAAMGIVLVPRFIELIPATQGQRPDIPTEVLILASIAQSGILLAIAAWLGAALSPRLYLRAPVVAALLTRRPALPALRLQIVPGVLGGVAGALVLLLFAELGPPAIAHVQGLLDTPLLVRVLYGGITEEILLRWGFMTLMLWLLWRFWQRREGQPTKGIVWIAIIVSAVIFGAGHLPMLRLLVPATTASLMVYVIVGNSVFGVMAGYLFWRYGLESAILAHMSAHVLNYLIRG